MAILPISGFSPYNNYYSYYQGNSRISNSDLMGGVQTVQSPDEAENAKPLRNQGESTVKKAGKKSSPAECETCANRKYQDGSDENVSYKTATKIDPSAAASAVRAHENEHVSNAYKKAAMGNGKVVNASVTIKTAICPECGRSYVSGGETNTQIKYYNEKNPYQQDKKKQDAISYTGLNLDLAV